MLQGQLYQFTGISPPTVSNLGGNTLTISGSGYPTLSAGSEILCMWENKLIMSGKYLGSTAIECPVPAITRFYPFDASSSVSLSSLQVSFYTNAIPTSVVVDSSDPNALPLVFRSLQVDLYPFTINPTEKFNSATSMVLSVTGTGFPYSSANTMLPIFRFMSVAASRGLSSASSEYFDVTGIIQSSQVMKCTVPLLSQIMPLASPPQSVIIRISFDGGQTYTSHQAGFRYLQDIDITNVLPAAISSAGSVSVSIVGSGFEKSEILVCVFSRVDTSNPLKTPNLFTATGARFLSPTAIQCDIPLFSPPISDGIFEILLSFDNITWVSDAGGRVEFVSPPTVGGFQPAVRGYYYGGTITPVLGVGFINHPNTFCVFGKAIGRVTTFESSSKLYCRSPPCISAKGYQGSPDTCSGPVQVSVIYGADVGNPDVTILTSLTFIYVAKQQILSFSPWGGSGWDSTFTVKVYGTGLNSAPTWCRWMDLPSVAATIVSAVSFPDPDAPPDADSFIVCDAPSLPTQYRPSSTSGLDFVLGYVEISCNNAEFTDDKRQWYFYAPPIVSGSIPAQVWRGAVRPAGITIIGSYFRSVNVVAMKCLWYYDFSNNPNLFLSYPATFINANTITCSPTQPVGPTTNKVRVFVTMSPNVVSSTYIDIPAIAQPIFSSVSPSPAIGPYLGGQVLTFSGVGIFTIIGTHPVTNQNIYSNLYVAFDDILVEATPAVLPGSFQVVAKVIVPPLPHSFPTPHVSQISFAVNLDDRLGVGLFTYTYVSIAAGSYYNPLRDTAAQLCPPGFYCGGGYPQNDTESLTTQLEPLPCPPGTYQPSLSTSGCMICPAPAFCPYPGMSRPLACPIGLVCWGANGWDATAPVCPMGKVCVRPISMTVDVGRFLLEQDVDLRSLLQVDPLLVSQGITMVPCPAGRVCPPGSVGIKYADNSVSVHYTVPYCSMPGSLCAPGTATPVPLDVSSPPGFYVRADGAAVVKCPAGFACNFGSASPCKAGTYQNLDGKTVCEPCTAGTVCGVAAQTLPDVCPPGRVCTLPGRFRSTYLCPAGGFCLGQVFTLNSQAINIASQFLPQICPEGTYCLPGTDWPTVNALDPSAPRPCAVGFFCQRNETSYQGDGACPVGYYCIAGSVIPVEAPVGMHVPIPGSFTPTKCSPGYYQNLTAQANCLLCPDGFQCLSDGTIQPTICPAGHYRSNADPSYTVFTDNIECHPCPEGTWNYKKGLVSSDNCITCPERYVCAQQGMTIFATREETNCAPNSDGAVICYEKTQGEDCPEGYACGPGTTSFTQYTYPCEAGYYCKSLTALDEMRNLLCPPGYYCTQATGASKAYASQCPEGFYCPQGTAGILLQATGSTGTSGVKLYNVQSIYINAENVLTTDVGATNAVTGSSCKNCAPGLFDPPNGKLDTSSCTPCGQPNPLLAASSFAPVTRLVGQSIDTTDWLYTPYLDWSNSTCPDGTTSVRGASDPIACEQICIEQGFYLAVINVYNKDMVVVNPRTGDSTPLWREDFELAWIDPSSSQYQEKKSLRYGQPADGIASVDFLGFDPRIDTGKSVQYVPLQLAALDILVLDCDFSRLQPDDLIHTDSSLRSGQYMLLLSSDKMLGESLIYPLPRTMALGNGSVSFSFQLKLIALVEDINVNVSVALLNGDRIDDMHLLNSSINVSIISPNKTDAGQPKSFWAIVSGSALNEGSYELPYNMPPAVANSPGDLSLVVDWANYTNYTVDPYLVTEMIPGQIFWQISKGNSFAVPWLPFFSNCNYFDRHIMIWDLLEYGDKLPPEYGTCNFVADPSQVETVAPFILDFSAGKVLFQSNSDWCELALQCRYEDNLKFSDADSTPWMAIPGTIPLFYLTQDPLLFSEATGSNGDTLEAAIGTFDSAIGTDSLIPVTFDPSARTGNFPRLVTLSMRYSQTSKTTKRLVSASIVLSSFDSDSSRSDYTLQISWEPMNWIELLNSFSLPLYVYVLVYLLVGLAVVGSAIASWGVVYLLVGKKFLSSTGHIPKWRLWDSFDFYLNYSLQGVVVGVLPPLAIVGIIKGVMYPSVDLFRNQECAWPKVASSAQSVILSGTDNPETCKFVRTGTCMVFGGIFLLWASSSFFSPRLPENQREYLGGLTTQHLQDDGLYYPSAARFRPKVTNLLLKWKRLHIFYFLGLITLPMMVIFALSYSDLFGTYTNYWTVGYMITMLMGDLLFVKVTKDKLTFCCVATIVDVVYFVATLSANNLNTFISSYLLQELFTIAQRVIAERALAVSYTEWIPSTKRWLRSRVWVWKLTIKVNNLGRWIRRKQAVSEDGAIKSIRNDENNPNEFPKGNIPDIPDSSLLKYSKDAKFMKGLTIDTEEYIGGYRHTLSKELIELEENIDQTNGVAGRTCSLVFAPFAILLMLIFSDETKFFQSYNTRVSWIPYYILFAAFIIPFQIALEIIINHSYDTSFGVRMYNYMYLMKWRWNNRLTRWLLDDARLDTSLQETSQSLHHLCFSPQFYFVLSIAVASAILITYGFTVWIQNGVPGMIDPAFIYYVFLMFLATRLASAVSRWLVYYATWKPADRAQDRAFLQSVSMGLKQKELEEHEGAFRNNFFKTHREWLIDNLDKVYTPRGVDRYRSQLSEIYQRILNFRVSYLYTAPPRREEMGPIEKPADDSPGDLGKRRFTSGVGDPTKDREAGMYDVDLAGGSSSAINDRLNRMGQTMVKQWLTAARALQMKKKSNTHGPVRAGDNKNRVPASSSGIGTHGVQRGVEDEIPEWVHVEVSDTARELLREWVNSIRFDNRR